MGTAQAPARKPGYNKDGTPRKPKKAKTLAQRVAGVGEMIRGIVRKVFRSAVKTDSTLAPVLNGIRRVQRDARLFAFYRDPAKVADRAKRLRERADKVELVGTQVQAGAVKMDGLLVQAAEAFEGIYGSIGSKVTACVMENRPEDAENIDAGEIIREMLPESIRGPIAAYVETPNPFAGTEDEATVPDVEETDLSDSEDEDEDEDDAE